jgi:hypothetical protein
LIQYAAAVAVPVVVGDIMDAAVFIIDFITVGVT